MKNDREECEAGGYGICQGLANYCPLGYAYNLCGKLNGTACCIRKL